MVCGEGKKLICALFILKYTWQPLHLISSSFFLRTRKSWSPSHNGRMLATPERRDSIPQQSPRAGLRTLPPGSVWLIHNQVCLVLKHISPILLFSFLPLVELHLHLREQGPSEHSQVPLLPSSLLDILELQQACSHPILYMPSCWICRDVPSWGDPTANFTPMSFFGHASAGLNCKYNVSCLSSPPVFTVLGALLRKTLKWGHALESMHLFLPGCHHSRFRTTHMELPKAA